MTVEELDDQVELAPTDDLDRTRRNLLFATSLLFILTVTNPVSVELPGFGKGAIHIALAEFFTAAATLFFGYEYWLEYRLTHLRNSALLVGWDAGTLDTKLTRLRDAVGALETKAGIIELEFRAAIGALKNHGHVTKPFDDVDATLLGAANILRALETEKRLTAPGSKELEQARTQLAALAGRTQMLDERDADQWEAVNDKVHEMTEAFQINNMVNSRLVHSLDEVSRYVFGFQRTAFLWKDLLGVSVFACVALALAMYRLLTRALDGLPSPDWGAWVAAGVGIGAGLLITQRNWKRGRAVPMAGDESK